MHVDRAGAAEVVVAPDLAEQLLAGEHPRRVRREEAQQLELLEGEVERPAVHLRRVAGLVDDDAGGLDLRAGLLLGQAADDEPDARIHLGRTGGLEHHVVDAPVGADRGQAALGEHQHERHGDAGGAQDLAQRLGAGEVGAGIDEDEVGGRGVDERCGFGGDLPGTVAEQGERGQHLGVDRRGQDQQLRHRDLQLMYCRQSNMSAPTDHLVTGGPTRGRRSDCTGRRQHRRACPLSRSRSCPSGSLRSSRPSSSAWSPATYCGWLPLVLAGRSCSPSCCSSRQREGRPRRRARCSRSAARS